MITIMIKYKYKLTIKYCTAVPFLIICYEKWVNYTVTKTITRNIIGNIYRFVFLQQ